MRRLLVSMTLLVLALLAPAGGGLRAAELSLSVDVPADLGATTFTANQALRVIDGVYALAFDGPAEGLGPGVNLAALHINEDGSLLFTADASFVDDGTTYEARDVVLWNGASFALYLAGEDLGLPTGAHIDALTLLAGGDLAISFDAPTTVGTNTYLPADLARVEGLALSLFFEGATAGLGPGVDVVGFDRGETGDGFFVFDAPVTLPGPLDVLPGTVVRRDAGAWSSFFEDPAFPAYAAASALSLPGSPGAVTELMVAKDIGDLLLTWQPSCSSESDDFAVHEGAIGDFASHLPVTCTTGGQTSRTVPSLAGDRYFLVVPVNGTFEGSYGTDSSSTERPPAAAPCLTEQRLRACP